MSMTFMDQLAIIPALVIALVSLLVWGGEETENRAHRFLMYVMGMAVLLLSGLVVTKFFITEPYNQPFLQFSKLLTPSVLALVALIIVNVRAWSKMSRKTRISVITLGMMIAILFALIWSGQLGIGFMIFPGALILALGWTLEKRYAWLTTALSLLSLAILLLLNVWMNHPPDYANHPPATAVRVLSLVAFYVIPGLAVISSAILITRAMPTTRAQTQNTEVAHSRGIQLGRIALAFILLIYLAYTIYWGSVWDHTNDGLFGLFVLGLTAPIAIGAGIMMILALQNRDRLAGFMFILIVPLILYQSFEAGWRVSYHEITEKRAARIANALEKFYAREGYYPASLDALTPRDLLLIQQPVILAGEAWCYEGDDDYYRLSAFYREFFSAPVSLRVYKSAGTAPTRSSDCEGRLDEMKAKYYSPLEDPEAMRPPLPTPVPDVAVEISKTEIQPLLNGEVAVPGSWSPDGAYYVFATQANGIVLQFLNGKTGEVCTSDKRFSSADSLRDHHVWLPDGRLLYIGSSGEIVALTPCQSGGEELEQSFPDVFTQWASYSPEQSLILVKSKTAYWILDADTLSSLLIPEVIPIPYDLHWETFAWLPGGEHLVIARLNGRKGSNAGSTLYFINGGTGQVENRYYLAGEFGQSAPWIEGLSDHELLVHGNGKLWIVDFKADPPTTIDVLSDIFGLDIKYPEDVSAAGSHVESRVVGYYLAVRINHPRNQAVYLYRSQTRRVYVYDHEYSTLLLFPSGYLMDMAVLEYSPPYQDKYEVVLVDSPETEQPRLVLTGHTPREDPHLTFVYLVQRSQLAVASAHGVSLISLPDGNMQKYWTLPGNGFSPWIVAAPDGSALVASRDFGGLYYIPLVPGN